MSGSGRRAARRWVRPAGLVLAAVLGLSLAGLTLVAHAPRAGSEDGPWVGVWAAADKAAVATARCPSGAGQLSGSTVRNVVTVSAGGDVLRVRVTNVFGTAPLAVRHATVGLSRVGAWVAPGTLRTLTFGGARTVRVAPGQQRFSDPVHLRVAAGQHLALSVLADYRGSLTEHAAALQTSYVAASAGDLTGRADPTGFTRHMGCWLMVDGVDVRGSAHLVGSVVALGDSITDGYRSSPNRDMRWPDVLARRLAAQHGPTLSVVDEGMSGDQLLTDTSFGGPSVLHRLDRDVIHQSGVRAVVVMIGTNDIGFTDDGKDSVPITVARLEAGYRELVLRLHAAGIPVYASPLTPFLFPGRVPATGAYQDVAGARMRQQLNHWIVTSGTFDGTVDFAAAVQNPEHKNYLDDRYASSDHLHPNDAGYRRIGDCIPLSLFDRAISHAGA